MLDRLWQLISSLGRRPTQSADSGIFDPYTGVGALKPLSEDYLPTVSYETSGEMATTLEEEVDQKRSFTFFRLAIIVGVSVLVFRLVFLQISQGQENYSLAEGNRLKTQQVTAPRGLFYDRNGVALVSNIPSFSVVFEAADLPRQPADQDTFITRLASILVLNPADLREQIIANESKGKKKKAELILLENIDRNQALSLEIKLNAISGVYLIAAPARQYAPNLAGLGQITGYVGKITAEEQKERPTLLPTSYTGKSGLEKQYDDLLQGHPGIETFEVDSLGRTLRQVGSQPPQVGESLVLALDAILQQTAATALQDAIQKNNATSGAAVVMNVRTGEVLSLVSFPLFNNNVFSQTASPSERQALLSDPLSPLVNRAIAGQYPSGSTIKPVVASAALEEKVVTPSTKVDTSAGEITVGQTTFRDWKKHGITDVRQAIAESNNIFFFTVGGGHDSIRGLGADRLSSYMSRFGFGQLTGIDLPGEQKGNVPTPDWKKKTKGENWYIGDTYNLAIGQGDLLVTPLQLTRATSAIANGGTLYQPKMIKSLLSKDGSSKDIPPISSRGGVVSAGVLETVRQGMRQTVLSGSARSFNTLGVEVAAKTGTAQVTQSKEHTHSWFTAFAPFSSPEIAVSVIVEGGGEGYTVAAPVAKNIIEQYFHLPLTPIVPAPPTD